FGEHTGTHFDAPIHWITGRDRPNNACDTIPVRQFVGPACVIDVTRDVEKNPDFLLTPARIESWEKEHGRIPRGAWVLMRTGWSLYPPVPEPSVRRRSERERYAAAERGAGARLVQRGDRAPDRSPDHDARRDDGADAARDLGAICRRRQQRSVDVRDVFPPPR